MFEALRIKIHAYLVSKTGSKEKEFVNPYVQKDTKLNPRLNPYVTTYGTEPPKKTITDIIFNRKPKAPASPLMLPDAGIIKSPVVEKPKPITFGEDVIRVIQGDLMFVASVFRGAGMRLRRSNNKKKERVMSAKEISKACEGIKWQ